MSRVYRGGYPESSAAPTKESTLESPFTRFLTVYPPVPTMTWRVDGGAQVRKVQEVFGIRVPSVLHAFWSTVGAGSFGAGELYVFGDTASALPGPELIHWNRREWWPRIYPTPVEGGPLFFAQTAFGSQIGFRWEGEIAVPIQFCPDTFDDWQPAPDLASLFADPPENLEDPALLTHARLQIGKLPTGKHYVPDLSPLLGGLGESFHVESAAVHLAGAVAQYEDMCKPPPEEPAEIAAMELDDVRGLATREVAAAGNGSVLVLETERKTGTFTRSYSLGLTLVADDVDGLLEDLREAKTALMDWQARRQESGDSIQLTFVVPEYMDDQVGSLLARIRRDEEELEPILSERTVMVSHLNRDGTPRFEYQLEQ